MHLIVLLCDVDEAEADFVLFRNSFIGRKKGARFAPNVPQASKSLWAHLLVLLCNVCQVEACFGLFECSVSLSAK
jgi:hypothetical protein